MRPRPGVRSNKSGFTLLETLIVVAIAGIVTITAVPKMTNVIANAKLRASMTSLSGLFQNTRMVAVQQNKTKTARFEGGVTTRLMGYVRDAGDTSSLETVDSQVEMEAPITKMTSPSGPGAPTAISTATLGFTPQTDDPSFNSRGLPCLYTSGTCPTNYGFIYYFKDSRIGGSGGWAAISISPAGRIKRWFWNGSAWTD
jgi:prepilin-type N-terminal cleavage/methylation domain-containing protein